MIRPDDLSGPAARCFPADAFARADADAEKARAEDLAMRRERYQRADRLAERILFAIVALVCIAIGYGLGWWL